MAVTVRWGRPEDAAKVAAVHVRGWQQGYAGLLPQDLLDGLRPVDRMQRWADALAAADPPRTGTLVAERDGDLAGFAYVGPARDGDGGALGEVWSFYVDPGHWRQGVGTALMDAAVTALVQAGYAGACLWVLAGNERAVGFYRHTGWVLDGATKPDVVGGVPIRDLRMTHPLREP